MQTKVIGTWKVCYYGIKNIIGKITSNYEIDPLIEEVIIDVENDKRYDSIGFGGLPNCEGDVELDAGFMRGSDLGFGSIIATKNIKNPIKVARELANLNRNCVLCAQGADKYARLNGFEFSNMLAPESIVTWKKQMKKEYNSEQLEAYGGHDTVCVMGIDSLKHMAVGVSTSGLFMKHPGRVSDSPIIGSRFYCDNDYGAAAATGVGEDIMRGCLSAGIIGLLKQGIPVQTACEHVLLNHHNKLCKLGRKPGSMSVLAMDNMGNVGVATNKKEFPFVVGDNNGVTIYLAKNIKGHIQIEKASSDWFKYHIIQNINKNP